MSELLADQGEADVLAVLVAVAHDHAAVLARLRQHREQLGLGAGLEPHAAVIAREDFLDHAFLLVDLDGVDGGVLAAVAVGLHRAVEGATQGFDAVAQDVGEAHQHRQRQARGLDLAGKFEHIDAGMLDAGVRAADEVALAVDVEVATAPVGDIVGVACLLYGPADHAASIK